MRQLRALVPAEAAAVVVLALVPLPIPRVVPLLVVATLSRWLRGRTWADVVRGPASFAAIGAAAGVAALALALVAGTPVVEALTGRGVEWSQFPIVRGSAAQLLAVATIVGASALAAELALRGWIVERVLELGGSRAIAVGVGALAEALLGDGDLVIRAGAALLGGALGWMYVAAGRSVVAPLSARLAFALGAVVLEALRLVS